MKIKTLKKVLADAYQEAFRAAAKNDCCGCNLFHDKETGEAAINPYNGEPVPE